MPQLYSLLGVDGREYGPADAELIRSWIAEKRVDGKSLVRPQDSSEWRPVRAVPELAVFLPPEKSPTSDTRELPTEAEILGRDYDLPIFECLAEGWQLLARQFGPLLGAAAIVMGIFLALGVLGIVPFAGLLTSPVAMIISGPLMGGLWHVMVRARRGESVRPGQVFDGFRESFPALLLVYLTTMAGSFVTILPGMGVLLAGVFWGAQQGNAGFDALAISAMVVGGLLIIAASLVLWSLWAYGWELIMDRKMGFWAALELSRKMSSRHFFKQLAFFAVLIVLMMAGYLACIVGIFFTAAWMYACYACAYDRIFGPRPSPRE